jgi:hypothetical protein
MIQETYLATLIAQNSVSANITKFSKPNKNIQKPGLNDTTISQNILVELHSLAMVIIQIYLIEPRTVHLQPAI